jgi:hypothetical protein
VLEQMRRLFVDLEGFLLVDEVDVEQLDHTSLV